MPNRCSIIIPNYNGIPIIGETLTALADYDNLTVVDDASTDCGPELIEREFPHVRVIRKATNGGFSVAANEGIRRTSGELVVLLNNDVIPTDGFLDELVTQFADPDVFSVSPRILLTRRANYDEGCAAPFWRHGLLCGFQLQDVTKVKTVLYATGCAAVYRRSMLEELGGFDEAYSPFYWEDVDLGYRAWKRGWKSLYQPRSTVHHQHSASISKLRASYTNRIKARNSLFFIWRNINDRHLLATHKRWLVMVLAKRVARRDWAFLRGWSDAVCMRNDCREANARAEAMRVLSDREIFLATGVNL